MTLATKERVRGFTLVELLAVVATIGVLAALLLPVLARAKNKAQRTNCQSNLRQLGFAWQMYASDNNGLLAQSYPVGNPYVWVKGDMRERSQAGDTELLKQGKLYPYNQNVGIYRCPADRGVLVDNDRLATVRSYSMNSFMGARDPRIGAIPTMAEGYVLFFSKESDLRRPSDMWVLLDEDERSINDGFFVTDPTAHVWIDFPATSSHRHGFSYALNFGDGHSEIWQHRDGRTRLLTINKTEQSGNTDLGRLAGATAVRK